MRIDARSGVYLADKGTMMGWESIHEYGVSFPTLEAAKAAALAYKLS